MRGEQQPKKKLPASSPSHFQAQFFLEIYLIADEIGTIILYVYQSCRIIFQPY